MFQSSSCQNSRSRQPLHIVIGLVISLMGISPAYSCAMGFSFKFEKLPPDTSVLPPGSNPVARFLEKKFGKSGWQPSRGQLKFKALDLIENSSIIPLTFGSKAPNLAVKIASIELYRMSVIKVIEFAKNAGEQKVEVNKMFPAEVPISSAIRIGPTGPKLMAVRIRLAATFLLNTDGKAPYAPPLVSLRVTALPNSRNFQAFAVFYPVDKRHLPIVATTKLLTVHGCETSYFVRGEWPENLRSSYSYQ